MQRFQHYIDGRFEDGDHGFESIDPATGEAWAIMPEAREGDVDRAVMRPRTLCTRANGRR